MSIKNLIQNSLAEALIGAQTFLADPETARILEATARLMADSLRNGGKIMSCGNGGSCCDAMHFAEELTGRYRENRRALPAIAIADPSHLTCVSNDFGYEDVFSRYIEGLGKPGDVLLGISTSGSSKNVLKATKAAKAVGMKVVILCGNRHTELTELADIAIHTPEFPHSDRVQELHIKCIHILIEAIENLVIEQD